MPMRFGLQAARAAKNHSQRNISQFLYKNVWRKSNAMYFAYILGGAVAVELVYGNVIDAVWNSYNKGVSQSTS